MRIIAGVQYNEHTNPIFNKFGILKLNDIYKVEIAKMIFLFKQNALPEPLKGLFTENRDIHTKPTRQQNNLYMKRCRTTLASQHISCTGPKIWNSFPSDIKNVSLTSLNIHCFTTKVKKHFLQDYVV